MSLLNNRSVTSFSNGVSSPLPPISPLGQSAKITHISPEGVIRLNDGRGFKIENLKIGTQTMHQPFTNEQLTAIKDFVQKTLDTSTLLKDKTATSYTISKLSSSKTNVTALIDNKTETETIKSKRLAKLLVNVSNVFNSRITSTTTIATKARRPSNRTLNQVSGGLQRAASSIITPLNTLENSNVSGRFDLATSDALTKTLTLSAESVAPAKQTSATSPPATQVSTNVGLSRSSLSTLSKEFKFNDGIKRQEIITRDKTVDNQIIFLGNMIKNLTVKMNALNVNAKGTPEHTKLSKNLDFFTKQHDLCVKYKEENGGKDWFDSNYFRDLIKTEGSFDKGIDSYISAPVNMRYQEMKMGDNDKQVKQTGFFRVGIMSDMRNGWMSVGDLEKLKSKFAEPETKKYLENTISQLEKRIAGPQTNLTQSAQFALNIMHKIKNAPTDTDRIAIINEAIGERKQILAMQMVQLVAGQVAQNPAKIKDGTFSLAHVSLLHGQANTDPSGWVHDERVEVEDMKGIFDEFNGYEIEFSDEGPLVEMADGDKKGKLYLPKPTGNSDFDNIPNKFELKTFFFNVCAQRDNAPNAAHQSAINSEQFNKLGNSVQIDEKVKKRVTSGMLTNYKAAINLTSELLKSDIALSIGCLSAKDRTGAVGAALIQKHVKSTLPKGVKNRYANKILDLGGLAAKVVRENTPTFRALKVNAYSQNITKQFLEGPRQLARVAWEFTVGNTARSIVNLAKNLFGLAKSTATHEHSNSTSNFKKTPSAKVLPSFSPPSIRDNDSVGA